MLSCRMVSLQISWQGAQALIEWSSSFGASTLGGRRVLELGSGTGLFGLAMLAAGGGAGEGGEMPRSEFHKDRCDYNVVYFLYPAVQNFTTLQLQWEMSVLNFLQVFFSFRDKKIKEIQNFTTKQTFPLVITTL